jgi:hypothetical protein
MAINVSDKALEALETAPPDQRAKFFQGLSQDDRNTLFAAASEWKQRKAAPAEAPKDDPGLFTVDNAKRAANALVRAETAPLGPLSVFAPQFDLAPMEATGTGGAIVRGVQKGASMGFADEDAGARAAAQEVVRGGGLTKALAKYREARDAERGADQRAQDINSTAMTGGEIAGALAVPLPFGKARAASLLGKLGLAAGRGALAGAGYGLGSSDADLTQGDFKGAGVDTAIGGGSGVLGGLTGEVMSLGVGKVLKKAAGRAQRGIQEAIADETEAQAKAQAKAEASAQGAYRSSVQSASRDLEVLQREADAMPDGPLKRQIQQYLSSPEGLAVRAQVAGNKLGTAPERIAEMQQKMAEFQDLIANRDANIARNTEEAMKDPVKRHVLPRVATLGHRFLPPAIASIGGLVGGSEGAVAGGTVGGVMSLTQGHPGRIVKNLMEKPAVRHAFWGAVLKASGGAPAVANAIPHLEQAAAKGEQSLSFALTRMSEESPELRDALRKAADSEQPDQGDGRELAAAGRAKALRAALGSPDDAR